MIKFDPIARKSHLTGFHKRKQARKFKGMMEVMQKERQDAIDVKRSHRDEVRNNWRDLQRANALSNKALMALEYTGQNADRPVYLKDAEDESTDTNKKEAIQTTAFDREEDDPFGDCEVTTVAFEAPSAASTAGSMAANAAKLWPALQHTNISNSWVLARGTWDDENADTDEAAAARFQKQRRAVVVRKKEQERAQKGLEKRVASRLGFKKKSGKKKTQKKGGKDGKKTKSTHSSRRKSAKKSKGKSK